MLVVRGVNVYPSSIEAVLRQFPQVEEFRIIVTRVGALDEIEVELECPEELAPEVERALRGALNLRAAGASGPGGVAATLRAEGAPAGRPPEIWGLRWPES